ncbi:MAG: aminotransferase class V-fold PLP-dependent enzyme, partial [Candidatus Rokubacteria bacterium]|nr:aminotransferase class V-fold PLP-dependent enzyme [Candidatus Rokubacteria bacterium]
MTTPTRPIYLDYASTTPLHPAVLAAMEPYLRQEFGNPSNLHTLGRRAAEARDRARGQVATVLGCHPDEVVFTGGGSESDNLALKGAALAMSRKRHLVTTAIEHSAVLGAARDLEAHFGVEATCVAVDERGIADPAAIAAAIRPHTFLVSVMLANNEIGTIQPMAEIARLARARGVLVHTDAVQAAGLLDLNVDRLGVDLL